MARSVPFKVAGFSLSTAYSGNDSAVKAHHYRTDLKVGVGAFIHIESSLFDVVLHTLVHSAVYFKSLCVDLFGRCRLAYVVVLGKIAPEVEHDLVLIPVLDVLGVLVLVLILIGRLEADKFHIRAFLLCLFILGVGDYILVVHFGKNDIAALLVVFGVDQRVELRGVLGDTRDSGAFGKRAVLDALAKIQLSRRLNALAVVAEVYNV